MGVLDDAIREHIALKRRNGADPSEVARLEHEAFGPITREPVDAPPADDLGHEPAAPVGLAPAADLGPQPALGREDDDGFADLEDGEQPPTTGAPHLGLDVGTEDPAAYAPPPEDLEPPAGHAGGTSATGFGVPADDPAATPHDPAGAAPEPPAEHDAEASRAWADDDWSAPPPREQPPEQPTQAYSLEDLDELRRRDEGTPPDPPDVVPADAEAHDELEETPDFLEETPEHDRLWFEQKPPKDFDF